MPPKSVQLEPKGAAVKSVRQVLLRRDFQDDIDEISHERSGEADDCDEMVSKGSGLNRLFGRSLRVRSTRGSELAVLGESSHSARDEEQGNVNFGGQDGLGRRGGNGRPVSSTMLWGDMGDGMSGWGGGWGIGDGTREFESLDFDPVNNAHWVDSCRRQPHTLRGFKETILRSKFVYRWVLTIFIGVGVALSAQVMQLLISLVCSLRNLAMQSFSDWGTDLGHTFAFFALYNLTLVAIAAILTAYLEPVAAGDGIAEIKAYLNGTHVKNIFRLRTVLTRFFGSVLSVSSGLACGPEGPMIHIGASIASGITRADKLYSCLDFPPSVLARFHNDRDRREFICAGAGAGMAAAFGAPVGGVLFALEEAASHWSPQLIWRIFTAALIATFTLALVKARGNSGDISLAGLLSFGTAQSVYDMKRGLIGEDGTTSVSAVDTPIYWWELVLFLVLGLIGGILGGVSGIVFNKLAYWRSKRPTLKVLEAMLVSLLTSGTVFAIVYTWPMCRSSGAWTCSHADNWGDWCAGSQDNTTCVGPLGQCVKASAWVCVGGGNNGQPCRGRGDCEWRGGKCTAVESDVTFGVRLRCPEGQYDELATIFFGTRELVIVRMVAQAHPHEPFTNQALLLAGATTYLLMLITYGTSVPMGLFMPCALIGASLGRLFGQLIRLALGITSVFSGAYALAGAAAMLGGVQRATISLIFILIEGTANEHFLLPIVTATLAANFAGNLVTREGVFDIGLRRKKLRFLPHEPDWLMQLCTVADVMARPVTCFKTIETVGNIVDTLRKCAHHGFPVLSIGHGFEGLGILGGGDSPAGRFEGVTSRAYLRYILGTRFTGTEGGGRLWRLVTADTPDSVPLDGEPHLYELIEYRRRKADHASTQKEWEWATFSDEDRARYVNVGAYMNAASCTVPESCPVSRAYRLFRSMGLRHLPVVDLENRVVGMLSRASFSKDVLHRAVHAYYGDDDLYLPKDHDPGGSRMRAQEQVQRLRNRVQLPCGDLGFKRGGPVSTWQTRLIAYLRLNYSPPPSPPAVSNPTLFDDDSNVR